MVVAKMPQLRKGLLVRLVMLGTGHALVTRCYNACFVLEDDGAECSGAVEDAGAGFEAPLQEAARQGTLAGEVSRQEAVVLRGEAVRQGAPAPAPARQSVTMRRPCFLVDAGGGNGILAQLERVGLDWRCVRDLFVTHTHIDHLLGAVWMLRLVCHHMNEGDYPGSFAVWGNDRVVSALEELARLLLRPQETRFLGNRVQLHAVCDGETREILGRAVTFFDIHSEGAKQFGFAMELDSAVVRGQSLVKEPAGRDSRCTVSDGEGSVGKGAAGGGTAGESAGGLDLGRARSGGSCARRFVCCGDEPFNEANRAQVEGAEWLIHEAFCLASEESRYNPHPIHHGTVAEACIAAERLGVKNLVLYHTEDDDLPHRKERYLAEGRQHFSGNLYVPDDLETFNL